MRNYDIKVCDTAFDPRDNSKVIHYKKMDNRNLYKVWIYLDGKDLPYVEGVNYLLHSTFENPRQSISRTSSNPNCSLIIWTWGIFTVRVNVSLKNGERIELLHELTYNQMFDKKDIEFKQI